MSTVEPAYIGHYEIDSLLGQGGMGTVYKARDPGIDRWVAIKTVTLQDSAQRSRFQQEIKAAGKLNYPPHIITIYHTWIEDDVGYIVMEYVDGGTLVDWLASPVPWRKAVSLLLPICHALAYAHRQGVIHRDVKPANILISTDEVVKLTDFGVARLDTSTQGRITTANSTIGTAFYTAPEQARNEPVDGRADIFSLGIVLFELITGQHPFSGGTIYQVLDRIAQPELADLTPLEAVAPQELVDVVGRALEKSPANRFSTADEMASALTSCLGQTSPFLSPPSLASARRDPSPLTPSSPDSTTQPRLDVASTIALSPPERALIRRAFAGYDMVYIEQEFKKGFSGARVLLATPVRTGRRHENKIVLKLDTPAASQKEWDAYNEYVKDILPMAARISETPVYSADRRLALLHYSFAGRTDVAPESLHAYYHHIRTGRDIAELLEKYIFDVLGSKWWDQRHTQFFSMRREFDRLLPVHLQVEICAPSEETSLNLTAGQARFETCRNLKFDQLVQIQDFVVEEIRPASQEMTLQTRPRQGTQQIDPIRIRVTELSFEQSSYQVGQVISPFVGRVTATRYHLLLNRAESALPGQDLSQEELKFGNRSFANPLNSYEVLLDQSFPAMQSIIHGDLNLENLLIAPPAGPVWLIDFATTGEGYTLFDLMRLETQVITKWLAELDTGLSTVVQVMEALHSSNPSFGQFPTNLDKPFSVLAAIRRHAQDYLNKRENWDEYYVGLTLMLLGALKFKELDNPARQVALIAATAVYNLIDTPISKLPSLPIDDAQQARPFWRKTAVWVGGLVLLTTLMGIGGVLLGLFPLPATPTPLPSTTEVVINPPPSPPDITPTPIIPSGESSPMIPPKVIAALDIYSGPGFDYSVVGSVPADNIVQVNAQDPTGEWLQIAHPPGPNGVGWVLSEFVAMDGKERLPTVMPPPTPSPTPIPTPSPTPPCPSPPFYQSLSEAYSDLGCSIKIGASDFTLQRFERGLMIWQKEPRQIYILYEDGEWEQRQDPQGPPQPSCSEGQQTGGLGPILSFGVIWCAGEKDRLGLPITGEIAFADSQVEQFEQGFAFRFGQFGYVFLEERKAWSIFPLTSVQPADYQLFYAANPDGEYRIYRMTLDNNQPRLLTGGPGDDGRPALSPDGLFLAFASNRNGNLDIFVLNLNTQEVSQLTFDPEHDQRPVWSPDGRHIAFHSKRAGNYDIYVMNADGSNPHALTDHPSDDLWPTWSPDGTQILFESERDDDKHSQLYLMQADGTNQTRLLKSAGNDGMPAWSSQGQIAFYSDRDGNRELYLIDNIDNSKDPPQRLTHNSVTDWFPAWSPDGRYLVYASEESGESEIYVLDTATQQGSQLTQNGVVSSDPIIAFAITPVPKPEATSEVIEQDVEDFETYPDTASLQQAFTLNTAWGKNDLAIELDTSADAPDGGQALAMVYNIKAGMPDNYVGIERKLPISQNWADFNTIQFWVHNDSILKELVFQWSEAPYGDNEVWATHVILEPNESRLVKVPLNSDFFNWVDWSSRKNQQLDLGQVGYFAFFISQTQPGSGTIYLDSLKVLDKNEGSDCETDPAYEFKTIWNAHSSNLGCPRGAPHTVRMVTETFEGGHLFWREDTDEVYEINDRQKYGTLLSEGDWTKPSWKWDGVSTCQAGQTPPSGLIEPERGFGWLWCTHLGGPASSLGWALDKEQELFPLVQEFDQGTVFKNDEQTIYALSKTGRFFTNNSTSVSSQPCSLVASGEFAVLWQKYRDRLGCPLYKNPRTVPIAGEQPFQYGHMFYLSDRGPQMIIVYDVYGDWELREADWWDGEPEYSCQVSVPNGLWQPRRGFGDIWCNQLGGPGARIGWALADEQGFDNVDMVQDFENGIIFRDADGKNKKLAYVFFKDNWTFVIETQ